MGVEEGARVKRSDSGGHLAPGLEIQLGNLVTFPGLGDSP